MVEKRAICFEPDVYKPLNLYKDMNCQPAVHDNKGPSIPILLLILISDLRNWVVKRVAYMKVRTEKDFNTYSQAEIEPRKRNIQQRHHASAIALISPYFRKCPSHPALLIQTYLFSAC